ncbi:LTXXQ domain protein [Pseudomonas tussilaginis]|uniref:LTXXQ domain protein n=1 Tax=Pseudomonas putida TaxID=303 RepID=UPI0023632FB2|nr:LTXXQ domain protein [Pseudomonas putida]MDD1975107.1 LTXXQ domain protein [Pseudomonas putida]
MRKTLIALMFAATLPTVAMAMPEDGMRHGDHHRGGAPFAQLDLSREQRQQIGKLMGEQMKSRQEITNRYLEKLPAADQKALKDELQAKKDKTHAEIRDLLKPDQQKKFDELKKEQDQRSAEWSEFKAWKAEKASKAQ